MDFLAYIAFRAFVWFVNLLPLSAALRLGGAIGGAVFRLHGARRRMVADNIMKALGPQMTSAGALAVAASFYGNLGMGLIEFARLERLDRGYVDLNVTFEGLEHADRELKKGRGVVFLSAHFGNWELLNASLALRGYPVNAVVRPLDNPYMDDYIERLRTGFGGSVIGKKNAVRRMLDVLSRNGILGILLDQRASRRDGIEVDFFGLPARTSKGLAAIVMKTGSAVIPVFIRRDGGLRHRVTLRPPLDITSTGNREGDIRENTQRFTSAIEDFIRPYPSEWFWFHSRWERRRKRQ